MRKLVSALLLCLLPAQNAFSFSIITDSNLFYSFFAKPQKVIDFTKLKDGTSISQITHRRGLNSINKAPPDCLGIGRGDENRRRAAVLADAFSDDWSFTAADSDRSEEFCRAIIWFDQGISSGHEKIAVLAASGKSKPFVLYTNKGFLGIVPDNTKETVFIFDGFSVVFSFETDFVQASTVSDSEETYVAKLAAD
mgnify:CR=1 FL=1